MLLDILREHLEETEILWSRRRAEVRSPRLDLRGLAALDQRLDAHLEGLSVNMGEPTDAYEAAMRGRDASAAFASSATLLVSGEPTPRRSVLESLETATPQARQGIVEALCYLPLADATRRALETRLDRGTGPDPAAIEALSFHRCLALEGLVSGVCAPDRDARRAIAHASGRVDGGFALIKRLTEDVDVEVRDAALDAGARSGLPWVLDDLRSVCRDSSQVTTSSIRLLACIGDQADIEVLGACAAREELGEAAVEGLATLGYLECVNALLDHIGEPHLTRAVGVAVHRITGLEPPTIAGESDSPEAEEAAFEDLRPVPDAGLTRALWHNRRRYLDPLARWRHGKPILTQSWRAAPHYGDLLTRREELTRLWAREPGRFRALELDAPAARQRAVTA